MLSQTFFFQIQDGQEQTAIKTSSSVMIPTSVMAGDAPTRLVVSFASANKVGQVYSAEWTKTNASSNLAMAACVSIRLAHSLARVLAAQLGKLVTPS